ncbi:MAG: substrate-binding domain-containing protein, partial [Oscillospiraceae bacterium]|nr:substrate-binding domain-containing protein [Oscillospiraceae bacterium]
MKKILALVLCLCMVCALSVSAFADTENFYTDDISVEGISVEGEKIIYLAPSLDIEYWQWVEDGVRLACEEYGVEFNTLVSENSAATQAENGETAAVQGVAGVVLSPVSSDSCSTVLDTCEDYDIPVTIAAIGSSADNFFSFISADDYTSGYDAGTFLCQRAKELGGDSIGVLALPMDRDNAKVKMA